MMLKEDFLNENVDVIKEINKYIDDNYVNILAIVACPDMYYRLIYYCDECVDKNENNEKDEFITYKGIRIIHDPFHSITKISFVKRNEGFNLKFDDSIILKF